MRIILLGIRNNNLIRLKLFILFRLIVDHFKNSVATLFWSYAHQASFDNFSILSCLNPQVDQVVVFRVFLVLQKLIDSFQRVWI